MNTDAFNRAQSNYDAMTPADRREPTDEDIRLYAEHIKPKLLASSDDYAELLSITSGSGDWYAFADHIQHGEFTEAGNLAWKMVDKAAFKDAEMIASDELYGDDDHSDTLRRIGADDWRTFFAKLNKEMQV